MKLFSCKLVADRSQFNSKYKIVEKVSISSYKRGFLEIVICKIERYLNFLPCVGFAAEVSCSASNDKITSMVFLEFFKIA